MRKVDTYYDGGDIISDGLIPDKWYRTVHMGKQFLLLDINGAANWNLTFGMYIDGNYLTTTGPSTNSMELSLTETTIMNAVGPGFMIRCGVLVSVLKESQKTDEVPERTIHLPKGGSGEIVLKTTIPVACQYLERLPIHDQCQLTLEMGKMKIPECTGYVQGTTDCSNFLTSLTANGIFEPAEIRFPIVTLDINYNDNSVFDIDLRFGAHTSALWHNYVLPSVRVQQKTKLCNNDRATCACGVAVRAGKDVFMINRCGSIHYIDFVHCGEGGILDVLEINSEKYRSWKERNHLYCFCQNRAAKCSPSQYYTCLFSNNITPLKCHVSQGYRMKRETDTHMKELRRLFDLMNSVDPPTHYLYKRQAEAQNITAEDAHEACTGLINGSLAVQRYSDLSTSENSEQVINNCAYDVEVGGTLVWANAHVESYNDLVKNMIDLQPEYAANNTERINVFMANTCPSNCTGNGNCTLVDTSEEGVCVCDTFYHGADCSIDERNPLIIDDIETGGECDTAERSDDCQCFAIRSGAILRSIRCTVKTFKIFINGEEELVSEYRSNGSYEDIFTGACCSDLNKYDVDAFAVKYEVSASNDGISYGNIKTVFVFDSTCQSTAYDGNTNGTVVLNTTSGCFIENTCYFDGEISQMNTCLGCNASVNATGWSEAPCTTTTTNPTTTVEPMTSTEESTTTYAEPTTNTAEPTTNTAEPTKFTAEPTKTTAELSTTTAEHNINSLIAVAAGVPSAIIFALVVLIAFAVYFAKRRVQLKRSKDKCFSNRT
ncbi:VWDE-like protein [Mya arenaria]|uniref:VWDE-like protein n=1 Tax=Mya arenaria TaxID=6604 RepID=A0ABY7E209_MYAAR|nr:VWDE-like protein [Mya arenaria]